MADPIVTVEVAATRRAYPKAQELLAGVPYSRVPAFVDVGWHDSSAYPETGATAVVRADGPHAELAGEILLVTYRNRSTFVLVRAGADVPYDLSLYRRAFLELALLAKEKISCVVEVTA